MEGRSRAPWITDPSAWGRVRLTRDMAATTRKALTAYLNALRSMHGEMPRPSAESWEAMQEIRQVEKVVEYIDGLQREKGWIYPPGD